MLMNTIVGGRGTRYPLAFSGGGEEIQIEEKNEIYQILIMKK